MTSQESCSSDVGSMPTASSDQETSQGVQSLKALSLNGLNQQLSHSASASEESQSMPSGFKGRPHPVLSWGEVTEIPNGAAAKSHEYVKHPIAGSSSSSEPWQVRSTQNPSRPLVRRPTPMAIRVPKSVLDKASKKMMAASFEEDEEERVVDGDQSPVPVSLKQGTTADVLVIEDIESSDADTPSPRISGSKDLHIGLADDGHTNELSTDTGSPTIVVRTDVGEEISHEDAEKLADADEGGDENDEEEDDFNAEDKHFLSPTVSKSFTKSPEPEPSNSRVQTVPHHPRKFVRRQTPIKLDVPKNLKDIMAEKSSEGIMEEEEEEEEEETEERKPSECGQQKSEATSGQVDDNQSSTEKLSSSSDETENAANASSGAVTEENTKNDVAEVDVSGRPDIITSVNCNNNNREASSLDLVGGANGTVKSNAGRNIQDGPKDMGSPTLQRQSLFKKSAYSGNKDGSGSPSSARRKVSPHHTKILKRQLTPLEVDLPKHIISEAMKKTSDSFLEEEEEDES
ncbi:nucleolar and coiled-body phosphoprotein 1-like [Lytechinus pictus]|uniref:nucleolar and coiled-body phosphoprotein 1-like n=1 Tax=Lytechinus pictus TaxID=7653 RepID=UPI0030B9E990